jgi:hypothetical protein
MDDKGVARGYFEGVWHTSRQGRKYWWSCIATSGKQEEETVDEYGWWADWTN